MAGLLRFLKIAIAREVRTNLLWPFYVNTGSRIDDTIFLAGSGRSGTTWVSNIINYDGRYRYIFEPFNPACVKQLCGMNDVKYLDGESRENGVLHYEIEKILKGQIRCRWTDRFNTKILCRERLIKDIRANLLLRYLRVHFARMPIILLIRHPFAVANSKRKLGWKSKVDGFLSQRHLVEDHLAPHLDHIADAHDDFDRLVVEWCVEHIVPFRQFGPGEIHIAFYENFCTDPNREIHRLFSYLGRTYDTRVLSALRRPSLLARRKSAVLTGADLVTGYKEDLTTSEMERGARILDLFHLGGVYGPDSMPMITTVEEISEQFSQRH